MRILIVGAGAVGGWFGAGLIEAGRDVTFLVRERRAEVLGREGLRVAVDDTVTVHAHPQLVTTLDADHAHPFDAVVLTVKAYALEEAVHDVAPFVGPDTVVIPLLNGMRHLDLLEEAFPGRVVGGLCVVAAQLDDADVVRLLAPGAGMTIGELDGTETPRILALHEALTGQGFTTRLSTDVRAALWQKWVLLASGGALTSLLDGTVGEIVATPTGSATAQRLLAEVAAVSTAEGYPPTERALQGATATLTEQGSDFTTSLYRDMRQGLPVENEHILGDLVARADWHGIAVPLLAAAYARIRVYEDRRHATLG